MVKKVELLKFKDHSERAAALEKAKREIPHWIQEAKFLAKVRMISYKAHIEQGFSEEQALFLCKEI